MDGAYRWIVCLLLGVLAVALIVGAMQVWDAALLALILTWIGRRLYLRESRRA